ncbi:hypothetical protein DEJ45_00495 [Streptomyces venezuelae]|uniref:hypothetical protein n=1 Tax=Streptomyces venezuelae TaxID=54571 RepID=UPI00123D61E1|nr:hypothetical protein [Streptomyces venezuelae]QES11053.1 hypothetical protein DEJ45_00495 [Streptomyces venezuelae]
MRGYAGVLIGNLVLAALAGLAGPVFLVGAYVAWTEGAEWFLVAAAGGIGAAGTALIPVAAVRSARQSFPRITRRDHVTDLGPAYGPDTCVVWAPVSPRRPAGARLVRADVLEASLVRYSPDGEATFTTYGGNHDPAEFKATVRLRLRIHDEAAGAAGTEGAAGPGGFEVTEEVAVPSLCLSAITAGRLAVLLDPPDAPRPGKVTVLWPRSLLLAGTRTCRVIDLDGRTAEVTRRVGRQLEQMRISLSVGGVALDGDVIDLRRLDADTAARYAAVARARAAEPQAPVTEPGEETRRLTESLPGEAGDFGSVPRRWSRRGGHLARGRFLALRGRTTFQDHGPVLDTLLRVFPADGTAPFVVSRRMTVPMNYLSVLHHTRDVVLRVGPGGRSLAVDWARTNLLAGVTTAEVVTHDGRRVPLPRRSEALWPLMNLLVAHGLSNPKPVLDLRRPRMGAVSATVLGIIRDAEPDVAGAGR